MTQEKNPKVIQIDMRGNVCPACLLVAMDNLNKRRKTLNSGQESLCIKTDNREAITTIPTTAKNMGYAVNVTQKDHFYEIIVGQSLPGDS